MLNIRNLWTFLLLWLMWLSLGHAQSVSEKAIETIKSYMDLSEDPCEDFYSYACGNWSNFHTNGRYSESTGLIDHKINKRLINLFERYNYGEDSIMDKVMLFYKSCRHDRKQLNIRYLKIAKPIIGLNWPLLEKLKGNTLPWPKEKFNWLLAVAHLRSYSLNNVLLEQTVTQNLTNQTSIVIDLDKPNLAAHQLPSKLIMSQFLKKLGLRYKEAHNLANELKDFENEIMRLLEIEDEYGVLMPSLHDIEDDFPQWPWRKYFETLLGQPVTGDYVFQIRNFDYFVNLVELLDSTDTELICNYIMLHFVFYLNIDRSLSSDKVDCMVDVRSKMDLAMNFIYAENFYKKEALVYNEDVKQLIEIIRAELLKKLWENRLNFNRTEIKFLEQKLQAMDLMIGNLPKNINHEFVENFYQNINLSQRDYYKNHLNLLNLRFKKEHEVLITGRPNSENYFFVADSDTARSSTPFYLVRQNIIVVPHGFLQTPIYHHNMLNVLKYSLLGFNIAHEIAHGFDASGVVFDMDGSINDIGNNLSENQNFSNALSCMQRDETTSLDERVADLVGLRLTYDAYFTNNNSEKERALVVNHNLSLEELFFLNFAQFFCGNMASEFVDHDSDNVRLQQTLINFEAFSETFQCDLGSAMNPDVKCRLW